MNKPINVEPLQVWDPGDRCPSGWTENGTLTVVRVEGDRVEFRGDGSPTMGSADAMLDPDSAYRLIGHEMPDAVSGANLHHSHAGWERAWGELWKVFPDDEHYEGVGFEGYMWQYVGTFAGKHQFKHKGSKGIFETPMISPDDWVYSVKIAATADLSDIPSEEQGVAFPPGDWRVAAADLDARLKALEPCAGSGVGDHEWADIAFPSGLACVHCGVRKVSPGRAAAVARFRAGMSDAVAERVDAPRETP